MKPSTALTLSLFGLPLACSGQVDSLEFSPGGALQGPAQGDLIASNSGSGLMGAGGDGGDSGTSSSYRPGGYAGGQSILGPDGATLLGDPEILGCAVHSAFLSRYSEESCTAGSLCAPSCSADTACPPLPGGLEAECAATTSGSVCVRACEDDGDCPEDMACLPSGLSDSRKLCLFPATPWAPGCDGYCMAEGDYGRTESLRCGEDIPCCSGLACAPWGECLARECLDFSWKCEEGGTPCCDGFSCQNGFCQNAQ